MMEEKSITIDQWKSIPGDAKIVAIKVYAVRHDVNSSGKALAALCNCANTFHKARFARVMQSGQFNTWLVVNQLRVRRPLKCFTGVYVDDYNAQRINLQRMKLLAGAVGIPDNLCEIIVAAEDAADSVNQQIRRVCDISEKEAAQISPMAVLFGVKRYEVASWPKCISAFANILNDLPFGSQFALTCPRGYEKFSPVECIRVFRRMLAASPIDKYSIRIEYISRDIPKVKPTCPVSLWDEKDAESAVEIVRETTQTEEPCPMKIICAERRRFAPCFEILES